MEHLVTTFARHGYAAVFVLMLLESACIPIPSEVTMLFAGFATSPSFSGTRLNIVAIILVGTVANLVGSLLAYWVGRSGGRPLLSRIPFVREHELARAEAWFARRGEAAVFFSRLLPVVRTFISLPAGIAEMPLGKFSVYTFAGSLPWVTALAILGRVLGDDWRRIVGGFNIASIIIAAIALMLLAVWILRRRGASRALRTSSSSQTPRR